MVDDTADNGNVLETIKQHSSFFLCTDNLLVMNQKALTGSLTNVESFVGDVGKLMADGMACFKERVKQQETTSQQNKESLLLLLVGHH